MSYGEKEMGLGKMRLFFCGNNWKTLRKKKILWLSLPASRIMIWFQSSWIQVCRILQINASQQSTEKLFVPSNRVAKWDHRSLSQNTMFFRHVSFKFDKNCTEFVRKWRIRQGWADFCISFRFYCSEKYFERYSRGDKYGVDCEVWTWLWFKPICEDCLKGVPNDVSEVDYVSVEDRNDVNAVDATTALPLISCEKLAVQTHFLIACVSRREVDGHCKEISTQVSWRVLHGAWGDFPVNSMHYHTWSNKYLVSQRMEWQQQLQPTVASAQLTWTASRSRRNEGTINWESTNLPLGRATLTVLLRSLRWQSAVPLHYARTDAIPKQPSERFTNSVATDAVVVKNNTLHRIHTPLLS